MYKLSVRAERDLALLYEYSAAQFGDAQAEAYLLDLEKTFCLLDEFPYMGRNVEHIRSSLRCHYHRSHSIYYKPIPKGIFIVRVLDQRMDQYKQLQ
ncbi:Toxin ParE4 [Mannheimia haemolytica]|uniref:Toxin n=1 Tax=Mannheimia haemolytica TaxID=75985 RepID=A0A3S4Z7Z0_MANHA|nr:type II toxin-antitoxin system RelE/ParE family toxin [Mannheimia haemolytica]VEI77499.1 Toxin ParE4 [Mannheimia haemolytica]